MSRCEQPFGWVTGMSSSTCLEVAVTQVVLMSRPRNWWKRKRKWKVRRLAFNSCKFHVVDVRAAYDPAIWPIEAKIPLVAA